MKSMKPYALYILMGILGPLVMMLLYLSGNVCVDGLTFGLVLGVLTVIIGLISPKERKSESDIVHRCCGLLPLLSMIFFPIAQILHSGFEAFLTIGLPPLGVIIFFAIIQILFGMVMFRNKTFMSGLNRPSPNMMFRMMSIVLRVREPFKKPHKRLEKIGLQEGQTVLDYGCAIGSYSIPASEIVGENGTVYALDIHPMAIKKVTARANKSKALNVKTILYADGTGLPNESVDVVLLYDVLQLIGDKEGVLREIHRILRPSGYISVDSDHLGPEEVQNVFARVDIYSLVSNDNGLFRFDKK